MTHGLALVHLESALSRAGADVARYEGEIEDLTARLKTAVFQRDRAAEAVRSLRESVTLLRKEIHA